MEKNKPLHPRIQFLLKGFVDEMLTDAEEQELDNWVCMSMDNQRAFEAYLEWAKYHNRPDQEDEVSRTIQYTAALIIKYLKNTISTQEQDYLNEWSAISPYNKELLDSLPKTDNLEYLCSQLRLLLMRQQYGRQLN